jgi:O-antigen ligase
MSTLSLPRRNETALVHALAGVTAAAGLVCAVAAPAWLWPLLAGLLLLGLGFLALQFPIAFCAVWLLVTGMTLEMTLQDALGPAAFQTTIAVVKATGVLLAALCAARWGVRWDGLNPAWGFLLMAAGGMAHGLYPGLTAGESLRSLAGSVAPFAFFFCRLPATWARIIVRVTAWCPLVAVAAGVAATGAGLRPLFIDSGGERLAGLGHPAFLAGVALAATYAALTELYRSARRRDLALLMANLAILVLTGARAPLAYAIVVIGLAVAFIPSPALSRRARVALVLAGGTAIPVLLALLLAGDLSSIRLFNMLNTDAGNLSGREYLWPPFETAASASPWFGWGVGAGNVIIPPRSAIAKLLHTWAAHNEYLRIEVEGGQVGRGVLILLFVLWVRRHTRRLIVSDRWIMRFAFLALAAHAMTDNVLISTPACVLFTFAAAVFARAPPPAGAAPQHSALARATPKGVGSARIAAGESV